ncbi:DUF3564 family protein [Caballeronia grimmiae]|uniref:DUF3564 family protein n=1 Tax=Caballeronia grimmiae TaxID=1071679 RepID=UPI0038BA341E
MGAASLTRPRREPAMRITIKLDAFDHTGESAFAVLWLDREKRPLVPRRTRVPRRPTVGNVEVRFRRHAVTRPRHVEGASYASRAADKHT